MASAVDGFDGIGDGEACRRICRRRATKMTVVAPGDVPERLPACMAECANLNHQSDVADGDLLAVDDAVNPLPGE